MVNSATGVAESPSILTMASTGPIGWMPVPEASAPSAMAQGKGLLTAPLSAAEWVGTAAEFPASLGTTGAAPASTFTAYQGGYVFGRSGWGTWPT